MWQLGKIIASKNETHNHAEPDPLGEHIGRWVWCEVERPRPLAHGDRRLAILDGVIINLKTRDIEAPDAGICACRLELYAAFREDVPKFDIDSWTAHRVEAASQLDAAN